MLIGESCHSSRTHAAAAGPMERAAISKALPRINGFLRALVVVLSNSRVSTGFDEKIATNSGGNRHLT